MKAPSFLRRFEQRVDQTPGAVAVAFERRSTSYRELDEQANRLASHLIRRGVAPDGVVAICGQRSPELIVAVLAVLKAGAGYLPLDAQYPSERLQFMLEDSRAGFLLRQRGLAIELPAVRPPELEIHADHAVLREGDATRPPHRHTGDSLAYAIYTSGSTGKPKGVAMLHRALDNLISWQLTDSKAGPGAATLQFAPLSFDVHFQEIFSTWCSGGRLVLVREETRLEMLQLLDLIEAERIERIFLPFIALQSLADIATGHDRIPRSLREGHHRRRAAPDRQGHPSSSSRACPKRVSSTTTDRPRRMSSRPCAWKGRPRAGRRCRRSAPRCPMCRCSFWARTAPRWRPARRASFYIGGAALARGYLFRPELTAARFVDRDGAKFYRTGDLVKELPDGTVQFLGSPGWPGQRYGDTASSSARWRSRWPPIPW